MPAGSRLRRGSAITGRAPEPELTSSHLAGHRAAAGGMRLASGQRLSRETVLAVPQVRVAARWMSSSRGPSMEM
ncbi:MAG: hypothetical protein ABSA53_18310 [Streptosporangiaceae bacterium]